MLNFFFLLLGTVCSTSFSKWNNHSFSAVYRFVSYT